MEFGYSTFSKVEIFLAAAMRYRAARVSSRSVVARHAATIRYCWPEVEKKAATGGGSGIEIVGVGDIGS